MATIFISDLHLEEQRPEITEIFLRFLRSEAKNAEKLYILGDFFEAWIGDDDNSSFNLRIINALAEQVKNGLPIYWMHGNRDFLIGKKFLRATGCQLLPDEQVINLYGIPTLLLHGDTLCLEDISYLKFRKKYRSWLVKKLILLKSLKSRRALAAKMRAASREHTQSAENYIMDVTQSEVERVMRHHNVQHLIHGHTHRQAVHQFELNQQLATRTVLGAWHHQGSALICHEDGKQEFVAISNN